MHLENFRILKKVSSLVKNIDLNKDLGFHKTNFSILWLISDGSNRKIPNLQKPNLEPTEPSVCSWEPNLETTEPPKNRTEPQTLLNKMTKNGWFFEVFPSKPNL